MADVNITYKGASIATITGSGTKTLNTRGKYCEGDITVQCTDAGGTAPSGSVTITENGTYDVTDKASAVVALPYVYKRWVVTIPDNHGEASAETVTLLTDAWLGQHYNDENTEVRVQIMNAPVLGNAIVFVNMTAGNRALITGDSVYKQFGCRAKNSTNYIQAHATELAGSSPSSRSMLKLNSNGDLVIRVDSNCVLLAGDYEIVARLIP